uniref:C2H2-type domain-containing protein n=1 Tax=Seriola dumerili TaxID=41447 RepID=A0A3B4VDU3_SERDU
MSKSEVLRGFVTERLAAASQEILAAVDGLVAGYEEEASGFREEIDRQRRLLEVLLQPRVILHKTGGKCSRRLRHDEEDNEDEYDKNLDMNNRTPSRGQFELGKHSGHQISEVQNHMDLRMLILEEQQPEVLSKNDVQHLLMIEEEVPPELSLSLDQEEPKSPNIKEEPEELWTSQEGEQLPGLEEADGTKVPLTPVHVKNEDDEEKPQSSQPHRSRTEESREAEPPSSSSAEQMETEADGEDCGGSEPDRNLDPHGHLQPDTDELVSESSETEDSDPESGLKSKEVHVSDTGCNSDVKPYSCPECGKKMRRMRILQIHMKIHSAEKPFGCDVCGERFRRKIHRKKHMKVHRGERPFGCDICGRRFKSRGYLFCHMKVHTGEKPFSCDICGKEFRAKWCLIGHMRVHSVEKPFRCDVCGRGFKSKGNLMGHMRVHSGERPFSCDVCRRTFKHYMTHKRHMKIHTGEKPFACDVCGERFKRTIHRTRHMKIHTGESPFVCDVCGEKFKRKSHHKRHMTNGH